MMPDQVSGSISGAPHRSIFARWWRRVRGLSLPTVLSFLFLLELLVLLVLIRTDPSVAQMVASRLNLTARRPPDQPRPDVNRFQFNSQLDPKVGVRAPEWRVQTPEGRRVHSSAFLGKSLVLVFVGSCGNCSLKQLQPLLSSRTTAVNEALVILTTDTASRARWLQIEVGRRATVLRDIDFATTRTYNAAWQPRSYLIDAGGRLTFCQGSGRV